MYTKARLLEDFSGEDLQRLTAGLSSGQLTALDPLEELAKMIDQGYNHSLAQYTFEPLWK